MVHNTVNSTGRAHGRGGPTPAITAEQRAVAQAQIEALPRNKRGAKRRELALLLGVHPNTLYYKPKRNSPAANDSEASASSNEAELLNSTVDNSTSLTPEAPASTEVENYE